MMSAMSPRPALTLAAFAAPIALGAFLLFFVQPMIAKAILPLLGGSAAVWNTCMVFFQGMLLVGYLYAHGLQRWASPRAQVLIHAVVLGVGLLSQPMRVQATTIQGSPTLWLLWTLLMVAGPPFFALSATSPLLQAWFTRTTHPLRRNPYPLYRASNAGSMVALLGYPLVVERNMALTTQTWAWMAGFGALALLMLSAGALAAYAPSARAGSQEDSPDRAPDQAGEPGDAPGDEPRVAITRRQRLLWLGLAFVPSSLTLGVTSTISQDIATIPLFWVVPLSLYLLTFIIGFAPLPARALKLMGLSSVALVLISGTTSYDQNLLPSWLTILLHMVTFFILALIFHHELWRRRPAASALTEFYLWMSLGGVLGGAFNALVAPLIFDALYEHVLMLGVAILAMPALWSTRPLEQWTAGRKAALVATALVAMLSQLVAKRGLLPGVTEAMSDVAFALALGLLLTQAVTLHRGARLLPALYILVNFAIVRGALHPQVIHQERSFFATHAVYRHAKDGVQLHRLMHGHTTHGAQIVSGGDRQTPLTYYHRQGPLGSAFEALTRQEPALTVGIIGLGAGAMMTYSRPQDQYDLFEIDPSVIAIAQDERLFTFMSQAAGSCDLFVGDGRLEVAKRPKQRYDALVLDAFSSDAIPIHLITLEAVGVYLEHIKPQGALVLHISNKYLDLEPVLSSVAQALGLQGRLYRFASASNAPLEPFGSSWAVLWRPGAWADALRQDPRWRPLGPGLKRPWTDQDHNLLEIYRWD